MYCHITELEEGEKSEKEQKSDLHSKAKRQKTKKNLSVERSVSRSNFENSKSLIFKNFFEELFVGGAAEANFEAESGMFRRNKVRKVPDSVVGNLERKRSG